MQCPWDGDDYIVEVKQSKIVQDIKDWFFSGLALGFGAASCFYLVILFSK